MSHMSNIDQRERLSRKQDCGSRRLVLEPPPVRLHFLIVGCGLGGLAAAHCLGRAGHSVSVFESATRLQQVGAGIQISPNSSRLLIRWGLGEELKKASVRPESITFRRYNTGERIGWTRWGDTMDSNYGAPYYHIHRADLLDMLFKLAAPHMTLFTNSRVVAVDPAQCQITLQSGETVRGDVVLGADGLKSMVREVIVGRPDKPLPTGDAAYRVVIPTARMMADPDLASLVEYPEMTGWLGPGRHIMAYCIRARREFNLVLIHPADDEHGMEAYDMPGSVRNMKAEYAGWDPRVQKLLGLVSDALIWPLFDRDPLETWVHSEGNVALLGDACHPMLPYRAQGSAMAIEDAAVLGVLFAGVRSREDIPALLKGYQDLRHSRTTDTQLASRRNQKLFHLADGLEQEARDRSMKQGLHGARMNAAREDSQLDVGHSVGNANVWADRDKSEVQFSYDAESAAERWLELREAKMAQK